MKIMLQAAKSGYFTSVASEMLVCTENLAVS
jgi:hypothetical protein